MKTLLVVDDDEQFGEMLSTAFRACGFHVLLAKNTGQGLAWFVCNEVDAVLSDFNMPHADGLTLCRAIRRECDRSGTRVPFWLMTGTMALTENAAAAAGAEGVFRKPFRPSDVATIIENWLVISEKIA